MPRRDLHLAFLTEKEVVKKHAQWRYFEMEKEIGAQSRKDPGAPSVIDGGGHVLSAWVTEECNRVSGQKLTNVEERAHTDLVKKARGRKLDEWKQFKV